MKILASPARQNRDRNPYNFLLSEALAAEGCEVVDLDDRNRWLGTWDILHIHWPQQAARGGKRQALRKSAALVTLLAVQRLRGVRIVWTVHNVRGHDSHDSAIERVLMRVVARLVHGLVFLTQSSRDAACGEMPALKSKPFSVIPHGLYGRTSTRTREEARVVFGLPPDRPTVGFLGDIKRYKGLDLLLTAFAETSPGELVLFIAGAFQAYSLAGQKQHSTVVRKQIGDLQAAGYSIVFREGRLDDAAFADAVRACDAVALPYREIWNSGLALLVLENGGRILAGDAPVFRELQDELGSDFVDICEGDLTGQTLVAGVRSPSNGDSDRIKEFAAARSWPQIATATLAFYRRLGAEPRKAPVAADRLSGPASRI
jgi:glycosyltransferase involved in cell wall biosynthesis